MSAATRLLCHVLAPVLGALLVTPGTSLADPNSPPEVTIVRRVYVSRDAKLWDVGWNSGKGFIVNFYDPKTWDLKGIQATSTDGFPPDKRQTDQERYFTVASWPAGYQLGRLHVDNEVDPGDWHDVEHTPQYELYLDPNRLRMWVWLRPRGYRAHSTDLHLDVTATLIRDDLFNEAVSKGNAFREPPGARIYFRNVDTCGHDHHLHIGKEPIVQVNESLKDETHRASAIFVPCH